VKFSFPIHIAWQSMPPINLIYILNLKDYNFYYFQNVASDIWQLISRGTNFEDLVMQISAKYAVDLSEAKADTEEFIQELIELELVVCHE